MADIIFLAVVAAFILYKFKGMLGNDAGIDPRELGRKNVPPREDRVIALPAAKRVEEARKELALTQQISENPIISQGLHAIQAVDPEFSATQFLSGAKTAFEWVTEAFSKGEKQKLVQLLAEDVFESFSREIDNYRAKKQKLDTTLVSILSHDITEAGVRDKTIARISVKFVSEQIQLVRDEAGAILQGDVSEANRIEDEWTFERDLSSRNPNWKIIAT